MFIKRWGREMTIDFVILWVDNHDPRWQLKKNQYNSDSETLNGAERYRDYGTLKYWFRMVEENAPWVNKIHFVTDHQIPSWLNIRHPKLHIVYHEDFMPRDTLPTFNSNAIQMYIHKIEGLSEHFVLFDDDMFIVKPIKTNIFFDKNGLPKDVFGFNVINPVDDFAHIFINNLKVINENYSKRKVVKSHFFKIFNWRYGLINLVNFYLLPFPTFTRFFDIHLPYAYRKSQYQSVMNSYVKQQELTGHHRFRKVTDISHWLVRYVRLVQGEFTPMNKDNGKLQYLGEQLKTRNKLLTISDRPMTDEQFSRTIHQLQQAFEKKYKKSTLEK